MTLAGIFILMIELRGIHLLFRKYFGDYATPATVEEFIREASLEDIVRLQIHQRGAFFGLCLATMGKLFS